MAARRLLADVYEQLGYQAESTSIRNTFLQGSFELRNGMPGGVPVRSTSPDIVRAMSTGHWLDFLGISMDPKKVEGLRFAINLVTPDNGEKFILELSNATLTNIEGFQDPKADLTITVDRADLNRIMMGQASFEQLEKEGKAKLEGDRAVIGKLRDLMVTFTPDFEILPGTAKSESQTPAGQSFALPPDKTLIETD
jgi:alkyl sulfatase BDS1-like metallo-beta-lactamase superfamily hydrolase